MSGHERRRAVLHRRSVLAGLGVAGLSPFIPLLNASGQEPRPKRVILFYTPHGTIWDAWLPTGTETSFTLSPILAPLERHKKKLVVLAGIGMRNLGVGAPHTKGLPLLWTGSTLMEDMTFTRADGSGGMYFGWNSSPSVDQVIANRIGTGTPYRSLELGVRSGGSHPASRMVYAAAKQPLPPATDPWAVFQRLYAGSGDQANAERQSALDLVRAELGDLGLRVAREDKLKIDAHLEAVRATEKRLQTKIAACAGPTLGTKVDPNQQPNTPAVIDRQIELLAAALACDLTRVVSLQYTVGDNDNGIYSWLGISDVGHHETTHAPDSDMAARAKLIKIYTWYADRFAYLLDKLDSIPEGSGTLLDNCIVVWGSELGKGNSHALSPTPFIAAGGAAGALATGRFLQYSKVDHNRLLVSMCHAMGLTDIGVFGNTDIGQGPLDRFLR